MGVRAAFAAFVESCGVRRTSDTPAGAPYVLRLAPTAVVFGHEIRALMVGAQRHEYRGRPRGLAWCRKLCCFLIFARVVRPELINKGLAAQ